MTQAECALALGVSRARISQIEARALGKLRAGLWDWRATP
jgi:DNA-directed RNA polymerase specialized sigma subunit